MALHTDLPIYRTGTRLLALAIKAQQHMPRGVKRSLGDKIASHCIEMLDLMALANATQRAERARHIQPADLLATGNSYLGLAAQASQGRQQQARIARALMRRGHSVAGDLSKAYRRTAA